ncbi:MAG: dockerin type I repeat-containing protein [Ruminococcus sp.]|nr:dockerin type I repeat-containing protein [Ruminococcus sp.]
MKGDIDGDGKIAVADLVSLEYYILGRDKLSSEQFSSADINNDGKVDTFDFVLLRKMLISK